MNSRLRVLLCVGMVIACSLWCTSATAPAYFGMHVTNAGKNGWPSAGFRTLRTWNAYPHVSWADINTSQGVYNWSSLDALVTMAQNHGVDILYTFGRTPAWASSNPTGYCANNAAGSCYPPSSQQYWKDFVTAVTHRYAGKIKYWEIWNEPNSINFWTGTAAQMVTMAGNAYPIIKGSSSAAVVVSPSPQGSSAYRWMENYFAAGGGKYSDVIACHGYLGTTNGTTNPAENIIAIINNMRSAMNTYGQGSKPLWTTEDGWGHDSWLPNQDTQAAWLARYMVLSWSKGVARALWYQWDSPTNGTLWDKTNGMHKAGIAYGQIYNWLVGGALSVPCSMGSNYIWTCVFNRPGGQQAEIIWSSSGSSTRTVPGQYTHYRDIAGNVYAIPSSQSLTIGPKPFLLLTAGSY
jgi:cellulase (glycosyl hydrolase family 5)